MSELIELVFESIPKEKIWKLIDLLLQNSKVNLVKYVNIFGEETIKNNISVDDIGSMEASKIYHVLVKFSSLIVGKITIYNADMWIEFDSKNSNVDILINFIASDLTDFMTYSLPELMIDAKKMGEEFSIKNYYCGLEPAEDDETRFFTKAELGPLYRKVQSL